MSDPVKTAEIEDVLSSIRRLVSESGAAPATESAPEPKAEAFIAPKREAPLPMERLVLTPSLRVAEPAEPEAADTDEPETSEAQDAQAAETAAEEDAQNGEYTPEEAATPEAESAEAPSEDGLEDTLPEEAEEAEISDRIAMMEAAVSQDEDWEDDTGGGGDNAPQPVETLHWEDHHDEPEVGAAGFAAGPVSEQDLSEDSADGLDLDAPEEAAVLDEEALRDLVTDIVRQELQGALGERITRNVRKLVRREIHRALMSQELE